MSQSIQVIAILHDPHPLSVVIGRWITSYKNNLKGRDHIR